MLSNINEANNTIALRSIEFGYYSIFKVIFDSIHPKLNSENTLEEPESISHFTSSPLNLPLVVQPVDEEVNGMVDHFYYQIVGEVADGLTFDLLPSYQSLIIADYVEVFPCYCSINHSIIQSFFYSLFLYNYS